MKKFAVIMAGGSGLRFWPKTKEKLPKQFIHLYGDGTLIQNTLKRLEIVFPINDIYVVVNEMFAHLVKEQLPNLPEQNIIVEPFGKNTAPAVGLVSTVLANKYSEDDIMLAFPADQEIANLGEFYQSLELAIEAAYTKNSIITIGIAPTRPETQFGYIQFNEKRDSLGELFDKGVRYCTTFAEKPDIETAKRILQSGDFLWNSGIFISKQKVFREAFKNYLPYYFEEFSNLSNYLNSDRFYDELEKLYMKLNPISLDYAILEKANNVLVIMSSFAWSDLGNWDELYRLSLKDARNNVIEGEVITINTNNSMIISNNNLICAIGVDDLIVVEGENSILICKKGKSEQVQELVEILKKKQLKKYL